MLAVSNIAHGTAHVVISTEKWCENKLRDVAHTIFEKIASKFQELKDNDWKRDGIVVLGMAGLLGAYFALSLLPETVINAVVIGVIVSPILLGVGYSTVQIGRSIYKSRRHTCAIKAVRNEQIPKLEQLSTKDLEKLIEQVVKEDRKDNLSLIQCEALAKRSLDKKQWLLLGQWCNKNYASYQGDSILFNKVARQLVEIYGSHVEGNPKREDIIKSIPKNLYTGNSWYEKGLKPYNLFSEPFPLKHFLGDDVTRFYWAITDFGRYWLNLIMNRHHLAEIPFGARWNQTVVRR